ncbi:MAG: M3 family metallopeptidase [Bacteroidales bacterium]|nr:M3 family metallopeptidase [Bacteroidales bacterium]
MNNKLLFAMVACLLVSCHHQKKENNLDMDNPFFSKPETPYGVPAFDRLSPEHFIPAFEEGMRQQKQEVNAITSNPQEPTFENTIEALEYSGELLNEVSAVFFNMCETNNSKEMNDIAERISPKLSAHSDDINLNEALFKRVRTVYEMRDRLDLEGEQLRLLEETYKNFVRGGAGLPLEKQERFRAINEQLSTLTLKFGNNVLAATNAYQLVIGDKADLKGLSASQIAAASTLADEKPETKGKWVFTLHNPSLMPFLQYAENREKRQEIWEAYAHRCDGDTFDNNGIIRQIVALRAERAQLLGYRTHADYVLDDCMAKTPEAVYKLLMQVWKPALRKASEEASEYRQLIRMEGGSFDLQPWDWRYYAEKVRKAKYDLSDEEIRPYFQLEHVRDGVFMLANRLYGLTFKPNKDIPVYHPDAVAYEVYDADSVIGVLYLDYFTRESKRSGAWMTEFRSQCEMEDGRPVLPVISLVFNFPHPVGDQPSLLNFDEAETFFHEFGHSLHGLLSHCHYRSLAGTNVPRDFVELPSQVMENWASHPEMMRLYARHYLTGDTIPEKLVSKIQAAATYGQGFMNTELIAASLLDMDYHTLPKVDEKLDPSAFEAGQMNRYGLPSAIISRYHSQYFQHIFASASGYSAGYYSYTWSAVLDADAFELFKEKGIFNREVAASFRKNILEKGFTEDPALLYRRFRGQDPTITPLLRKRGLL